MQRDTGKRVLLVVCGLGMFVVAGLAAHAGAKPNGDDVNQAGLFVLCAVLMAIGVMMLIAGGGRGR